MDIAFTDRAGNALPTLPGLTVSQMKWNDAGGCDEAELVMTADLETLYLLTDYFRYGVQITGRLGERSWWGFVWGVEIQGPAYRWGASLGEMANRIAVAYTLAEANSNGQGTRATTAWAEDASSIAEFGTKEALISGGNLSAEAAEQMRDTALATRSRPQGAVTFGGGETGAVVICRGWMETLGWKYASWPAVTGISYETTAGAADQAVGAAAGNTQAVQQITVSGEAINVLSVQIYGRKVGSPADNLRVHLYDLDGSGNPLNELAVVNVAGSGLSTSNGWITATLSTAENLAIGQYAIKLDRSGANDGTNYYMWMVNAALGYSGGVFKLWNGSAWVARGTDADALFIVTVDNQVDNVIQIEELAGEYGQFFTDVVTDGTIAGQKLPSFRDGDTDALGEVLALMAAGTTNDRRILAEVDADRRLILREEPASTAVTYRLLRDGAMLDAAGGQVTPFLPQVGVWVNLPDLPDTASASLLLNVALQYMSGAEWMPMEGKADGELTPAFRGNVSPGTIYSGGGANLGEIKPYVLGWTQEVSNYTPAWTGATTNPAIGNGTITGRYALRGKTCRVDLTVTMGSTTTYGSGAWSLSLPFQAASGVGVNWFGVATCYDSSAGARYDRNTVVVQGATVITQFVPQADATTTYTLTSAAPFTWASGDILAISVEYEVK